MVGRSKLNVITSRVIITTMGIATAGLLTWRNWRTIKQGAKVAVQAIMHPAKTIRKAVQKATAGVAYVKRQATRLYTATKRIIIHPIRTGKQLYRKYTPKPVQRFNRYVKRTVNKRYNSARKPVSRFVKNTRARVKKFFRRKRR